jgi:glycine/D-amino acid oxidase-like deaminating enzyme
MMEIGDHAVVLGAGIAGLLAARVLADAFQRVTVVERDPLPEAAEARRGVPQARHVHVLVPRGTQLFEDLFPGLMGDLAAGGVPVIRDFAEMCFAPGGHRLRLVGRPAQPFICKPAGRIWRSSCAPGSGGCPASASSMSARRSGW